MTEDSLRRDGAGERVPARCSALSAASYLGCHLGRFDEALAYAEENLSIASELGDAVAQCSALNMLGVVCCERAEIAKARHYQERALSIARGMGDKRRIAYVLNSLAEIYHTERDLPGAQLLMEEVVALHRERGDRDNMGRVLCGLSMVLIAQGAFDRVGEMLREVVEIAREIRSAYMGQSALNVCAGLAACREEWEFAARWCGAADAEAGQMGLHRDIGDETFIQPLVTRARNALGQEPFAAAEAAGRALAVESALMEIRAWLANNDDQP